MRTVERLCSYLGSLHAQYELWAIQVVVVAAAVACASASAKAAAPAAHKATTDRCAGSYSRRYQWHQHQAY